MPCVCVFFFNDTATTEIYTLSLHDALPIFKEERHRMEVSWWELERLRLSELEPEGAEPRSGTGELTPREKVWWRTVTERPWRSEEHTSELQSRQYLVCRLLLEKKKEHMLVF